MDIVYARCAGLDVHKTTVVACVRKPGPQPDVRHAETQTFATTLRGLRALRHALVRAALVTLERIRGRAVG